MVGVEKKRVEFIKQNISKDKVILDLGIENRISRALVDAGYTVINSGGEDLDVNQDIIKDSNYDVVTAFEILEHLFNPYTVLNSVKKGTTVITTVPLRHILIQDSYFKHNDSRMSHFHEFEDWQIIRLFEKTNYVILDHFKCSQGWMFQNWSTFKRAFGIRPIIRQFKKGLYIVAKKI